MRASEFINEQVGAALSKLAVGAGGALAKVTKKLGAGAANMATKAAPKAISALGGLETAGEKAAANLASKAGLGKTGQTMASVIGKRVGKQVGNYVQSKITKPPGTGGTMGTMGNLGTNQSDAKPVAKGDTIDSPQLGEPVKVKNVSGTDVEVEVPGEPNVTLKAPKNYFGVR